MAKINSIYIQGDFKTTCLRGIAQVIVCELCFVIDKNSKQILGHSFSQARGDKHQRELIETAIQKSADQLRNKRFRIYVGEGFGYPYIISGIIRGALGKSNISCKGIFLYGNTDPAIISLIEKYVLEQMRQTRAYLSFGNFRLMRKSAYPGEQTIRDTLPSLIEKYNAAVNSNQLAENEE